MNSFRNGLLNRLTGGWNGTASREPALLRGARAVAGMVAGHQQAAAGALARRQLVEPGDDIFVARIGLADQLEELAEVAERRHPLVDVERIHAHQADRGRQDHAGQPHAADRRLEQPRIARRRAVMEAAVGAQQLERLDMAAERAAAVMVLAVHVIGDGAAKRHELGARHDLREEAVAARHAR